MEGMSYLNAILFQVSFKYCLQLTKSMLCGEVHGKENSQDDFKNSNKLVRVWLLMHKAFFIMFLHFSDTSDVMFNIYTTT